MIHRCPPSPQVIFQIIIVIKLRNCKMPVLGGKLNDIAYAATLLNVPIHIYLLYTPWLYILYYVIMKMDINIFEIGGLFYANA